MATNACRAVALALAVGLLTVPTTTAVPGAAPTPELIPPPEDGIGPGSELDIEFADRGTGQGCTANFLWTDREDRLYLGTAGHCLLPGNRTSTHAPGADYDPGNVSVEVAPKGCTLEPSTFVVALDVCLTRNQTYTDLGPVVLARNTEDEIHTDFGLVCIPPGLADQARAQLPHFGGPEREATGVERGDRVAVYGHALGYDATTATESRTGRVLEVGQIDGWGWWGATLPIWSGDSGAGVVTGESSGAAEGIRGIGALGVATKTNVTSHNVDVGVHPAAGPTVDNVQRATAELAGLQIELVTETPDPSQVASCPS